MNYFVKSTTGRITSFKWHVQWLKGMLAHDYVFISFLASHEAVNGKVNDRCNQLTIYIYIYILSFRLLFCLILKTMLLFRCKRCKAVSVGGS